MSRPYRSVEDGELIRAEDWNEIQSIIKEEVRSHRHGGGAEEETNPAKLGGLLQAASLIDGAISTEKIAKDAVSARVLGRGVVQPEHFRTDAAIDESKVLFDPDEPVAFAVAEVTLRAPEDVVSGGDFLWPIPAGTPITNSVGDIVFRTSDPVSLSSEEVEAVVAVRCEVPGTRFNVPAGTLTRVGGALDPFLREHLAISQEEPAQGGQDPTESQAPLAAQARVGFQISPHAPLTFWVIPQGTVVRQATAVPDEYIEFVTRQSLSVFPGSGWVDAEAIAVGEAGNVAMGSLTRIVDSGLALRVAVDQPTAATGGEPSQPARVPLRFRLLGAMPASPFTVPAGTEVEDGNGQVFTTVAALWLHSGGSDYVTADPGDPAQDPPDPGQPFEVDAAIRPRLDKIYEPVLARYVSSELDTAFAPDPDDPNAVRLVFSVSERAPHAAWRILADARFSVTPTTPAEQAALDNADPLPLFASTNDLTLFARSGWVLAEAVSPGSDNVLPAGSLNTIQSSSAPPELIAALEMDQPVDGSLLASGFAQALVRFRVIEGTPLPPGQDRWEVPAGTEIRDDSGIVYQTREGLFIGLGAHGKLDARSDLPGEQGNLAAETLNRVLPESEVRTGNVVDLESVTPYLSVLQREDATGGGPLLARARVLLDVSVSERAPRTTWLIPGDTRLLRASGDGVEFETIDPLPVLARAGWVWAEPEDPDDEGTIPEGVLTHVIDTPIPFVDELEVWQSEPAQVPASGARVRVWFRVVAHAVPQGDNTWTIPVGTVVTDRTETVRFVTTQELILGLGGVAIAMADSNKAGTSANGIGDLAALANPEDFECLLQVEQPEPAEGGADGGSDGHHHKDEPGALPSHPLADGAIGAEQVAIGAVTWPKLSAQLAARLKGIRDGLKAVEEALLEADALQSLMKQRHRSADL